MRRGWRSVGTFLAGSHLRHDAGPGVLNLDRSVGDGGAAFVQHLSGDHAGVLLRQQGMKGK